MSRVAIFRFAAVFLLLLTGAEVFGCEILFPNGCESDRPATSQGAATEDCCLCCCAHIVVVQPIQLAQRETTVAVWTAPDVGLEVSQPSRVYHPPRV